MNIRLEQPQDHHEVERLTREAFWNVYRPGCTEHYVLHQYRNNPDYIPQLSFVLEEDSRLIGHVMFSRAEIVKDDGTIFPAWTFGPISIHPEYKRRGYGLQLLRHAIDQARQMGVGVLCIEGNIDFYRHAGFVVASTLNIHYHGEPRESDVPYFLAQELIPGYLDGIEGTYHTPKGYYAALDNPDDFAAYDATFDQAQVDGGAKLFKPGQLPQFCQSCGMPLTSDDDCGTNADGNVCHDYCRHCYDHGRYTQDLTMDQMIDHCAQFVDQVNQNMPEPITAEQYRDMMRAFFPMLIRWRKH